MIQPKKPKESKLIGKNKIFRMGLAIKKIKVKAPEAIKRFSKPPVILKPEIKYWQAQRPAKLAKNNLSMDFIIV